MPILNMKYTYLLKSDYNKTGKSPKQLIVKITFGFSRFSQVLNLTISIMHVTPKQCIYLVYLFAL